MPILNNDLCYILPKAKPALICQEIEELPLDNLIIKLCEKLHFLLRGTACELSYETLFNEFKRHLKITYSKHTEICLYARIIYSFLESNELPLNWKVVNAITIADEVETCTEGLLSRFKIIKSTQEVPVNLDEILSLVRRDIVDQLARKNLDENDEGNHIHTYNQFFTIASAEGYGILPTNDTDYYVGSLTTESVKLELINAFNNQYNLWEILHSIENLLRHELLKLNYFGPNNDIGGYKTEYTRFLDFLRIIIPLNNFDTAALSILNDEEWILDINWAVIRAQLCLMLKDQQYIFFNAIEEEMIHCFLNEDIELADFECVLKEGLPSNEEGLPILFEKTRYLIKCLDFFQHWSKEKKQILVNSYLFHFDSDGPLFILNELHSAHMDLIDINYDAAFFATQNTHHQTPIGRAIMQGSSSKLKFYLDKLSNLSVDEQFEIICNKLISSPTDLHNDLIRVASQHSFAFKLLLDSVKRLPADKQKAIIFLQQDSLIYTIVESQPKLLPLVLNLMAELALDETYQILNWDNGYLLTRISQVCQSELPFFFAFIEEKFTTEQLQNLLCNVAIQEWNFLQLITADAPHMVLPLWNLLLRIQLDQERLKAFVIKPNCNGEHLLHLALAKCHEIVPIIHKFITTKLTRLEGRSFLNRQSNRNKNHLLIYTLQHFPEFSPQLWEVYLKYLTPAQIRNIIEKPDLTAPPCSYENTFTMALKYNSNFAETIWQHLTTHSKLNDERKKSIIFLRNINTLALALKHCKNLVDPLLSHMVSNCNIHEQKAILELPYEGSKPLAMAILYAPEKIASLWNVLVNAISSSNGLITHLLSNSSERYDYYSLAVQHNQIDCLLKLTKNSITQEKLPDLSIAIFTSFILALLYFPHQVELFKSFLSEHCGISEETSISYASHPHCSLLLAYRLLNNRSFNLLVEHIQGNPLSNDLLWGLFEAVDNFENVFYLSIMNQWRSSLFVFIQNIMPKRSLPRLLPQAIWALSLAMIMRQSNTQECIEFIYDALPIDNKSKFLAMTENRFSALLAIITYFPYTLRDLEHIVAKIQPKEYIHFLRYQNANGCNSLMMTIQSNPDAFLLLVNLMVKTLTAQQVGTLIAAKNKEELTIFLLAAASSSFSVIDSILTLFEKNNIEDLMQTTLNGQNALMLAASSGSALVFARLIQEQQKLPLTAAIDIFKQQKSGQTILTNVIEKTPRALIDCLIYISSLPCAHQRTILHHINIDGDNILMIAIKKSPESITPIIEHINKLLTPLEKYVFYSNISGDGRTLQALAAEYCPNFITAIDSELGNSYAALSSMFAPPSVSNMQSSQVTPLGFFNTSKSSIFDDYENSEISSSSDQRPYKFRRISSNLEMDEADRLIDNEVNPFEGDDELLDEIRSMNDL